MPAPGWVRNPVIRFASSDRFLRVAPSFVPRVDRWLSVITRGRYTLSQWILPSVTLVTTGARTGARRTTSLAAVPLDGARYVVASNFGGEHHPAWSYNLIATPDAEMTIGRREVDVTAELLDGDAKAAVWPDLVDVWPPFDKYAQRSGRDLRVFRLVPRA